MQSRSSNKVIVKGGELLLFLLPAVQNRVVFHTILQLWNRALLHHDNPCFIYKFSSLFLIWRLLQYKWQPLKAQVQPKLSTSRIDPPQMQMEWPPFPCKSASACLKPAGILFPLTVAYPLASEIILSLDLSMSGWIILLSDHILHQALLKGVGRFNRILSWQQTESEHECLRKHTVHNTATIKLKKESRWFNLANRQEAEDCYDRVVILTILTQFKSIFLGLLEKYPTSWNSSGWLSGIKPFCQSLWMIFFSLCSRCCERVALGTNAN